MINPYRLQRMNYCTPFARPVLLAAALCISATAVTTLAQDFDETERTGWFVRADAVARFNVKASVKELALPERSGLERRIYDDGFVLPDVNQGGRYTWNWGYVSAGQVAYDVNNQPQAITFSRLDSFPVVSGSVDLGNPMLEGEIVGGYRTDDFHVGKHKARIAFEAGYGYFSSSESLDLQAFGTATRIIDTYRLNGVVPPVPPYSGTLFGPGPLISLYPANMRTNYFASTTTFHSSLSTTFHNFRVGPAFNIDLGKRLSLQLGAGYDSLYAHVEWTYASTSAATPNGSNATLKQSKWRPGVYTELLAFYQLTKHIQVFLGGDFQINNDMTVSDGTHELVLELGSTYAAKGGLSYSF